MQWLRNSSLTLDQSRRHKHVQNVLLHASIRDLLFLYQLDYLQTNLTNDQTKLTGKFFSKFINKLVQIKPLKIN